MSTVSRSLTLRNPDYWFLEPGQRKCQRCHRSGVYCHGGYHRLAPGEHSAVGMAKAKVLVSRFWCIQGKHTFSILPRALVRRVRIPLPILVFLSLTKKTWDTLEGLLSASRSTLARWMRLGKMLAAKLPEILAISGMTWMSLSQRISLLQYRLEAKITGPTLPRTVV